MGSQGCGTEGTGQVLMVLDRNSNLYFMVLEAKTILPDPTNKLKDPSLTDSGLAAWLAVQLE